ncbi:MULTISPECIES: terminase small subunit [Burkholderia]|uniref:terminase small subunit n=1 Tax=Burkholderia TaxID=32008 RepID=UPI000841BC2F|nr:MULTISPECIES: terminase small subunit [unclassified Burkholderia]AOK29862.1 hypothetical protein AQ611_10940 [Burkholderia sp. Bp7605]
MSARTEDIEVSGPVANAATLAKWFGVTPRHISRLAETGVLDRTGRNTYQLDQAIPTLFEALGSGGEVGTKLQEAKLRKLDADATRAELALAKERGEVAPIEQMERAWTNQCQLIQANMRRIPQRAVVQLIGETEERRFKEVLLAEIDSALKSAAEVNPELDDETEDADD